MQYGVYSYFRKQLDQAYSTKLSPATRTFSCLTRLHKCIIWTDAFWIAQTTSSSFTYTTITRHCFAIQLFYLINCCNTEHFNFSVHFDVVFFDPRVALGLLSSSNMTTGLRSPISAGTSFYVIRWGFDIEDYRMFAYFV
jgi:hypothetical protein